jgi:hypothetical protein
MSSIPVPVPVLVSDECDWEVGPTVSLCRPRPISTRPSGICHSPVLPGTWQWSSAAQMEPVLAERDRPRETRSLNPMSASDPAPRILQTRGNASQHVPAAAASDPIGPCSLLSTPQSSGRSLIAQSSASEHRKYSPTDDSVTTNRVPLRPAFRVPQSDLTSPTHQESHQRDNACRPCSP